MTSTRPKLKALREEHGWTQQDVADQVARMAWLRRRERVGVNADMVSKWERGQKRPTPLYRDMLAQVFSVDAHDLGLGGPAPAGATTHSEVDGNSLIEMLGVLRRYLTSSAPPGRSCSHGCSMYGRTSSCSVVPY